VRHAELQEVGPGAWAAIARPDRGAVGNAGFVDLGGETLVFDTHVSLAAGRELRAAAEQRAPVRTVVLSHWHGDHVFGAGAFDDATVFATTRTAGLMHDRTERRLAEFKAAPPEDYAGTAFEELARSELPTLELRHPDETFESERTFSGATRSVQAITFGGGHTLSDAVLWLADERIVFTADLVVTNGQPWVGDGDIDAWPVILEKIAALRPERIVPGHGEVSGPEALDVMRRYLEALKEAAPGDPNPFPELAFPEMWERNLQAVAESS
jgi:glyoxylase-like metal-dependent hydrolase (beta-lactamase superfamily II)